MPDEELVRLTPVTLVESSERWVSRPGLRVNCEVCGEEIINQREVWQDGRWLCRSCAGAEYYRPV